MVDDNFLLAAVLVELHRRRRCRHPVFGHLGNLLHDGEHCRLEHLALGIGGRHGDRASSLLPCLVLRRADVEVVHVGSDGSLQPVVLRGAGVVEVVGDDHCLVIAPCAGDGERRGTHREIALLRNLFEHHLVELQVYLHLSLPFLGHGDGLGGALASMAVHHGNLLLPRQVGIGDDVAVLIEHAADGGLAAVAVYHDEQGYLLSVAVFRLHHVGNELARIIALAEVLVEADVVHEHGGDVLTHVVPELVAVVPVVDVETAHLVGQLRHVAPVVDEIVGSVLEESLHVAFLHQIGGGVDGIEGVFAVTDLRTDGAGIDDEGRPFLYQLGSRHGDVLAGRDVEVARLVAKLRVGIVVEVDKHLVGTAVERSCAEIAPEVLRAAVAPPQL